MSRPARFSRAARRAFDKALGDMEHIAAAERLYRLVEGAARHIGEHPGLGRREPAWADPPYRFWSVPGFSYVIVYRDDRNPPAIVRFVHTAQDLPRVLSDRRDFPEPDDAS